MDAVVAAGNKVLDTDLLVIGAGINGAGIAADAAGRGLSVILCDQADIAGATSSSSTKLIHGGLRYLETWQFRLVRESLQEREVLLKAAPHIIWPMRFCLPHHPGLRPKWMIRLGLFLYDHLSRRISLPASSQIKFDAEEPLQSRYSVGFEYSDCWVDDARLVIMNARQAANHGALVLPRTKCVSLVKAKSTADQSPQWSARLVNQLTQQQTEVRARCVINASGPWVDQFVRQTSAVKSQHRIRLVKGSHIVVPRFYSGDESYLLQNSDGRVVFVIPYEQDFCLIGTTEQDYAGDPQQAVISQEEITYLCQLVGEYFNHRITPTDVCHHYAGVRPLMDEDEENASKVSRDYTLELSHDPAPLLSVYGGKITTYRRLAEAVLHKLSPVFGELPDWTASACLPGGDFGTQPGLLAEMTQRYPFVEKGQMSQWIRRYGTLINVMLKDCRDQSDLGTELGPGLFSIEVDYLVRHEWACTAEDVLWRRTKLGLRFSANDVQELTDYIEARSQPGASDAG
ncbi:glycerol-3-phosphate dehydrogenase [Pseudohongiella spirulinae]|uniref:Glycerol-3-phosphate dehydrogenase n=1 Tax=Pseudohongiella spirulinae TaxID=1249552 RepID=A0A0S2KGH1_9GAMM|nr:glycerol-3-phosphate dehydrogenase [Pseudohongiella spirulinae]ALO47058.1 glycerol-3-phosphate dehydrogenase [Pseudohongiella spirulinae]